jgi:two-component system NtrC family response regulator
MIRFSFENIIGESKAIKETIEIAKRIAQIDIPVLLTGETGTGKELFAQSIHNASSRKNFPFVTINCSLVSKELLESELINFIEGYPKELNKRGLLEEAKSGTIFLNEIGEIDFSLQAKLLRIFETDSFIKNRDHEKSDVRIITSTNKNLESEIEKNNFRRDLFYRMSVAKIEIPPLRDRKGDIELLTSFFADQFSKMMNKKIQVIDPDFFNRLKDYPFPGNVRELKNVIERTIILTDGDTLKSSSLPKEFLKPKKKNPGNNFIKLNEIEKQHIIKILHQAHGNKTKAARMLGIGLTTLYRKLHMYGIRIN